MEASNPSDGGHSVTLGLGMSTSHRRVPNQPKVIAWSEQTGTKFLLCQVTRRLGLFVNCSGTYPILTDTGTVPGFPNRKCHGSPS